MAKKLPQLDQITGNTPLRLDVAAAILFPDGSMTGKSLRREAAAGRLAVEKIAGKLFTTRSYIQNMKPRPPKEKPIPPSPEYIANKMERRKKFREWRELVNRRMIYIIKAGSAVKIGYSSKWQTRLKDIQVCCPDEIKLIAVFNGSDRDEANLHKRFSELWIRGEWFRCEGILADWIADGCNL